MTKEAIDQIFSRAQQGDVSAMALVGQLLEGKYIQADREKAIHFLRQAAGYNCLYARDLLQDEFSKRLGPNGKLCIRLCSWKIPRYLTPTASRRNWSGMTMRTW